MKRYLPIIVAVCVVLGLGYVVVTKKEHATISVDQKEHRFTTLLSPLKSCAKRPNFLAALHAPSPVMIDLSQKRYKGIALLCGRDFNKVIYPPAWRKEGHFGTYVLDKEGNILLVPMPYISIKQDTFDQQKHLYLINTDSGQLAPWKTFNDIQPSANNPYGLVAIAYDCEDDTLWVSALDRSDYHHEAGRIYHVDRKTKRILQQIEHVDALSLALARTKRGKKVLLVGSARRNVLLAYTLEDTKVHSPAYTVTMLPSARERIRKIKVRKEGEILLETIDFSYTLISQSAQQDRILYHLLFRHGEWVLQKQPSL